MDLAPNCDNIFVMSKILIKIFFQYPNDCEVALKVYITEINKEINELESHNYDINMEAQSIMEKEKEISKRYIFLAGVVKADSSLERECILTAFSMNPTEEFYALVCYLNDNRNQITTNGNEMIWNKRNEMAADLSNFIMGPRIKKLSWDLPWQELKIACEELVRTEKKRQIIENSTAAANEKLKFINLDYAEFRNLAPQEIPGIHNGFEIFVPDDGDDEILPKTNDSDDTDSAPESKEFIQKERKRVQAKKRRLLKRRHQLMELTTEFKNDENPSEKKRRRIRMSGDSLKPIRPHKPKATAPQPILNKELASDQCDINMEISTLDSSVNDTIITDISTHTHIQISDTSGDSKNVPWPTSDEHAVHPASVAYLAENYDQPTSDAIWTQQTNQLCMSALNTINNSNDSNDSMGDAIPAEFDNFVGNLIDMGNVASNGIEAAVQLVESTDEYSIKEMLDLNTKEISTDLEDINHKISSAETVTPIKHLMSMDDSTPTEQQNAIDKAAIVEHENQTIATAHSMEMQIVSNIGGINDSKVVAEQMNNETASKTKNPLMTFRKKKKSLISPMEQCTPDNSTVHLNTDQNKVIANP